MLPLTLRGRLSSYHQVHGCKQLLLPSLYKPIRRFAQALGRLPRTTGEKADGLKGTHERVRHQSTPPVHAQDSGNIPHRLGVPYIAAKGPVPRGGPVVVSGEVLVELELEAGRLDGLRSFRDLHHLRDAAALLDSDANAPVLEVVVVVLLRHEPLVDAEDAPRLQHLEHLAVHALQGGRVDRGLDGVDGVERVLGKWYVLLDEQIVLAGASNEL